MAEELNQDCELSKVEYFPVLASRPSTRSFHGDDFVDHYEWIRYAPENEVLSHIRAENDYYAAQTAHLADLREELVREYASHTKEDDLGVPTQSGNFWYWSETRKGEDYARLWRLPCADFFARPDVTQAEIAQRAELVYDANALAEGEAFFSIGAQTISRDGKLCALAIDNSGGETFRVRIHEIATGAVIDDVVCDATYGLVFNADASRIYYLRADAAWRTCELWVHQIGTSTTHDVLLWRENDERFEIWIDSSRDGNWLILNTSSRTTSEVYLLDLRLPQLVAESLPESADAQAEETNSAKELDAEAGSSHIAGKSGHNAVNPEPQDLHYPAPFTLGGRCEGLEYYVEPAGDALLVTHNLHNADFEIAVSAEVGPFEVSELPVIFSPQPGERVADLCGFADFAAVEMRSAGVPQIRVLRRNQETMQWEMAEALPVNSGETLEFGENYVWDSRALVITRESLITPLTVSEYEIDARQLRDLKVTEVPNFNPENYVEYTEWATAADGTRLPITVAHKSDLARDGSNPGYIYGYGSYEITNDVWFNNLLIPLLDRGIVVAFTHVRGGGEFGRSWYEHGKILEKRNTFTDFIDSTRHLVDIGLIDATRIAAEGRSAGGLLMGAIANLAPELYRVILAGVPFVDALTTILKPELPLTVGEWEEWGNPLQSPKVYAYMKSYSPYENIADAEYPAILATTSLNDVRVSFLEPTKWVAALREQTRNYSHLLTHPILLKTEMVAGHRGGSGRYQRWENRASEYAFLLDQLGLGTTASL